ncbi:hypothetical protein PFISCL1PPCAC_20588, partial [Pristionchus fissidentatus]
VVGLAGVALGGGATKKCYKANVAVIDEKAKTAKRDADDDSVYAYCDPDDEWCGVTITRDGEDVKAISDCVPKDAGTTVVCKEEVAGKKVVCKCPTEKCNLYSNLFDDAEDMLGHLGVIFDDDIKLFFREKGFTPAKDLTPEQGVTPAKGANPAPAGGSTIANASPVSLLLLVPTFFVVIRQ